MSVSKYFFGTLYQRMSDDLHLAGLSQRTHDGYLRAVRQLAEYCQSPPDQISEQQLRRFFLHLKNERRFATGSMRVALSGIKFFYRHTCPNDWATLRTLKIQNVKQLPEVLTIAQVHRIIDACTTERMAVYFWTVYSMGLRLQEGLNLRVGDIDADRGLVHIHRGKGAKDRYVPLPTSTLHWLRRYWATHQHPKMLFPAEGRDHRVQHEHASPMSVSAVQLAIKQIVGKLSFGKRISLHTLRRACSYYDISLRLAI